ncbi:EF-hand domain-containing protein [Amycolatopsis sp. NPDC051102]|uniref:EF-hand domain-containing protein n=1 Tax=Amycolatopsis sp. NPDC051102 TaxID=3155163 RepID=UPI00341E75EB
MTTAITTDRLRQRFAKWDVDGSGTLERADFEREAERVAGAFGAQPGSKEATALRDAFRNLFDFHAREAGVPPNGSVSEDQFIRINEKLMFSEGEASFNRVLRPVMQAIVGLCDRNADGMINQEEFIAYLQGVGVDQSTAQDAFRQIDTDNSGELTVDELLAAVRNFHYGKLDVPLLG